VQRYIMPRSSLGAHLDYKIILRRKKVVLAVVVSVGKRNDDVVKLQRAILFYIASNMHLILIILPSHVKAISSSAHSILGR